jgi:hypothetical protein
MHGLVGKTAYDQLHAGQALGPGRRLARRCRLIRATMSSRPLRLGDSLGARRSRIGGPRDDAHSRSSVASATGGPMPRYSSSGRRSRPSSRS